MNKKYLMKGMAALALLAGFSSCVKDVDGGSRVSPEDTDKTLKEVASLNYGLNIPDGQTWDMTSQVTANVTVNGDYNANYIVNIYEENPFINNKGTVLGRATVKSGNTANFTFTCSNGMTNAFAAIKDEKGYTYVKPVAIVNGKIEATFAHSDVSGSRSLRALTLNAADNFVIPVYTQPAVAQYLEGAREVNSRNAANDYSYGDLSDAEKALVPDEDKIQMGGWIKVSQKKLKLTHDWNAAISALGLTDASEDNKNARTLYIENATWTLPENTYLQVGQGTVIVVGANGHIVIPASATVKFTGNANYNCQLIVLPTGSITGEGTLEFSNGSLAGKYDYNAGTIDVGKLNNNGGEFYNAGIVKATVLAGGAGLSTYINAGKFTITRSDYGSGSSNTRLLNNCWFEAKENLFLRNLVQGAGAYVKVGTNFEMSCGNDGTSDPSYIYAKSNSLLDVLGAAGFNNVDIVGPSSGDFAYMQFGWIEDAYGTHNLHNSTNYTGWPDITCGAIINNIRISVDNQQNYGACAKVINEMLNGTAGQGKQVGNGNAEVVQKGQYNIAVVDESECSPGIIPVPPTPIYEEPKVYSYAFEDRLDAYTDYDLNDVVLQISFPVTARNSNGQVTKIDSTKLNVTLMASGAEFQINAYIGQTKLFGKEVHEALGKVNDPSVAQPMINTGRISAKPVSTQIGVPAGWDGDFNNLDVWIYVNEDKAETTKSRRIIKYLEDREKVTPYAIMVPGDWRWPTEQTNIWVAYPGKPTATANVYEEEYSFKTWAETSDAERTTEMKSWYNYPFAGKTFYTTATE